MITAEATNLFLRENGQEVLKVMEPQLKRKLSVLFAGIVNQLLRHVPVEVFLLPWISHFCSEERKDTIKKQKNLRKRQIVQISAFHRGLRYSNE